MDTRIARAIDEMKRRLAEPLRVSDLAVPADLSPSRFAHLFRSETGISPVRHLQTLRMDHARALLESTTLPVRAVMRMVGCNDPSHFARDFRRRHGMSPRQLRRLPRVDAPEWRLASISERPHEAPELVGRGAKHGKREIEEK